MSAISWQRFKPYKGVSSNNEKYGDVVGGFSVSNPIREYLQMKAINWNQTDRLGFKPYKGVSSNVTKISADFTLGSFQTL